MNGRLTWLHNRRLKWLQDRGVLDQTKPPVSNDSLKTTVIKQIFRDASNNELLDLQKYVQWQLFERGRDVKVVLSTYCGSFRDRCIYHEVYVLVIRPIILGCISTLFPNITEAQHYNIVELIVKAISPKSPEDITINESELLEKYGISVEELSDAHDEIKTMMDAIDTRDYSGIYEQWRKYSEYTSMSITNSYLISAVEQLRNEGVEVPRLILTTIRVPYGKTIKQCFDSNYGDYVEFVDEKKESDDSNLSDEASDEASDDDY